RCSGRPRGEADHGGRCGGYRLPVQGRSPTAPERPGTLRPALEDEQGYAGRRTDPLDERQQRLGGKEEAGFAHVELPAELHRAEADVEGGDGCAKNAAGPEAERPITPRW